MLGRFEQIDSFFVFVHSAGYSREISPPFLFSVYGPWIVTKKSYCPSQPNSAATFDFQQPRLVATSCISPLLLSHPSLWKGD